MSSKSGRSAMNRFRHRPLDGNSTSIRLLKFEPWVSGMEQIRCRIMHTTVAHCPKYYALSYTWGHDQDQHDIFVDGCLFNIRASLWGFMHEASRTITDVPFWIDALCIDQTSKKERGQQVRLMGSIYGAATQVIVWLGNEGCSVSYLFWLLAETEGEVGHLSPAEAQQYLSTAYMLTQFIYWSRVWIIQELLLASHIELMYNDDMLAWSYFWTGVDNLLRLVGGKATQGTKSFSIIRSYAYRHFVQRDLQTKSIEQHKQNHLNELLERYSASQCTILRDRLVGLLSLLDGGDSFEDSYEGTRANLILRAFYHFRGNMEVLGRLRQALRVTHAQLYEEIATWQPNRISHLCTDPARYRGEMIRFEASSACRTRNGKVECTTCSAVLYEVGHSIHTRATIYCMAGMGSSQHMVCVVRPSSDDRARKYVLFFHKSSDGKDQLTKFRQQSRGLMAIHKRAAETGWLYLSIDLFVSLAEYLRLPENGYKSPVPPTQTIAPVPGSTDGSRPHDMGGEGFDDDPVGLGIVQPVRVGLLAPFLDGKPLEEWF